MYAKHGLTLNKGFKRPNLVLDAHFELSHFWRRREERKGERDKVCKRSSFGWFCSPLLAPKRFNNLEKNI